MQYELFSPNEYVDPDVEWHRRLFSVLPSRVDETAHEHLYLQVVTSSGLVYSAGNYKTSDVVSANYSETSLQIHRAHGNSNNAIIEDISEPLAWDVIRSPRYECVGFFKGVFSALNRVRRSSFFMLHTFSDVSDVYSSTMAVIIDDILRISVYPNSYSDALIRYQNADFDPSALSEEDYDIVLSPPPEPTHLIAR
jgi:hypothetical protein